MKNFIKYFLVVVMTFCVAFAFVGCQAPIQEEEAPKGIVNVDFYVDFDEYGQEYTVYVFTYTDGTEQEIRTLVKKSGFANNAEEFTTELENAIDGTVIKLTGDIVLAQGVTIDKDVTIVLYGHSISAPTDEVGDGVFHVVEGGKLTINGDGVIDGTNVTEWAMAIWVDGGEAILNGGTYTNLSVQGTDTQYDLIYVKNGGKLTINGGTYTCKTPKWTLNNHDTKGGVIEVMGGKFICYNPAMSYTENPVASFVVDGYEAVEVLNEDGTWYTYVVTAD